MNLNLATSFDLLPESKLRTAKIGASALRFSRHGIYAGQMLAIGTLDGHVGVYDELADDFISERLIHTGRVNSVAFSRHNRYLASTGKDYFIYVQDLQDRNLDVTVHLESSAVYVDFHPLNSQILMAVLASQEVILIDLHDFPKISPLARDVDVTCALWYPTATHIFCGLADGQLKVIDLKTLEGYLIDTPCTASIKSMAFNTKGSELLLNSTDRTLRVMNIPHTVLPESETYTMQSKFLDAVNKQPWCHAVFSADGDSVVAGSGTAGQHALCIWDKNAEILVKALDGPRDSCMDIQWHPTRAILLSLGQIGHVYTWGQPPTQAWAAFAPGFEELEENVDYREPENEFDTEQIDKSKPKDSLSDAINLFKSESQIVLDQRDGNVAFFARVDL